MKLKVGDKVRFLNESGGGVVSKIISSKMVNVTIEDGFDVPTLTKDLIKPDSKEKSAELFHEDFIVEHTSEYPEEHSEVKESEPIDRLSKLRNFPSGDVSEKGVYLAFTPHDESFLIAGHLDIFLINYTGYEILFSLFLEDDKGLFLGTDYDVVPAESMILLDTIERDELNKWLKGIIQILFHNDKSNKVLMPASSRFKVKGAKLSHEGTYRTSTFLDTKAYFVSITELTYHKGISSDLKEKKFDENIKEEKAKEVKKKSLIEKHKTLPSEAEVDLHIAELINNIAGLSSRDMLNIQKEYFIKCLESAIAEKFKKVTFIHGVGNGVLKNEIINILKDYESLKNQSASLAKFGVGAIDVLIK
ncbi:MAG: DUF2027 domain-containing protein [Bacteroidales bacterium]|nr:DUF2027 domain-containing protein [Bacteroidales bacterium]